MMAFRFPSSPSPGRLPFCLLPPGRQITNPDVADGPWKLENEARPFVRKIAMLKKENGASFRPMENGVCLAKAESACR
ncbi:hypothetical protein ACVWWO_000791 [Bradyrhizobium sp. F1.13.1]